MGLLEELHAFQRELSVLENGEPSLRRTVAKSLWVMLALASGFVLGAAPAVVALLILETRPKRHDTSVDNLAIVTFALASVFAFALCLVLMVRLRVWAEGVLVAAIPTFLVGALMFWSIFNQNDLSGWLRDKISTAWRFAAPLDAFTELRLLADDLTELGDTAAGMLVIASASGRRSGLGRP